MPDVVTIRNTILLATCCFLAACKKDVSRGTNISAKGYVVDSIKHKHLAGVTIYLYGAHQSFYGTSYDVGPLDSTISDNDGNFSIGYKATGNSVDYALRIGLLVSYTRLSPANYIPDNTQTTVAFNNVYQLTNVILMARELNYALVKLSVTSNPYDTLYLNVSSPYGAFFYRYGMIGPSIDTALLVRYLPGEMNNFEYAILTANLDDSAGSYKRSMTDTLSPQFADTIVISKTIGSTYDLPLLHY